MKSIRVLFLGLYYESWDSMAEVYELMANDERFHPTVVTMPRKLTGDRRYGGEAEAYAFFESQGIDAIRLTEAEVNASGEEDLQKLREIAPDYIITNYPWQRNYPPSLRFDRLVEFSRLVYIPYFSIAMVLEPDDEPGGGQGQSLVATHLYTQRLHQLASLVFTQDDEVKAAYAGTDRGSDYVHFTGSPKIDALVSQAQKGASDWPIQGDGLKVIWAPHHSYSSHWLNFGLFAKIKDEMLDFAKQNPLVQIVLRPHPFLWGTLVDRKVLSAQELASWLKQWGSLENTWLDQDGGYASLFLATDILITDGISFLAEYPLVTGKPAIFFENPEHWKFSSAGELAAAASIRVSSFPQLTQAIANYSKGLLPSKSLEIQDLIRGTSPNLGQSASRIVEIIAEDLLADSGASKLVDKALIRSTAWELLPGREPFDD
jgi:CDP-glycerol glycerophosphotransferase (TagB/SpsB family)